MQVRQHKTTSRALTSCRIIENKLLHLLLSYFFSLANSQTLFFSLCLHMNSFSSSPCLRRITYLHFFFLHHTLSFIHIYLLCAVGISLYQHTFLPVDMLYICIMLYSHIYLQVQVLYAFLSIHLYVCSRYFSLFTRNYLQVCRRYFSLFTHNHLQGCCRYFSLFTYIYQWIRCMYFSLFTYNYLYVCSRYFSLFKHNYLQVCSRYFSLFTYIYIKECCRYFSLFSHVYLTGPFLCKRSFSLSSILSFSHSQPLFACRPFLLKCCPFLKKLG